MAEHITPITCEELAEIIRVGQEIYGKPESDDSQDNE